MFIRAPSKNIKYIGHFFSWLDHCARDGQTHRLLLRASYQMQWFAEVAVCSWFVHSVLCCRIRHEVSNLHDRNIPLVVSAIFHGYLHWLIEACSIWSSAGFKPQTLETRNLQPPTLSSELPCFSHWSFWLARWLHNDWIRNLQNEQHHKNVQLLQFLFFVIPMYN